MPDLKSQPVIIRAPVLGTARAVAPVIVPVFNILVGAALRPELVGRLTDQFSAPLPIEGRAGSACIKVPGSDFIIPPQMAQAAPAMRRIIDYQYSNDRTRPENRSGDEYCSLFIIQSLREPFAGSEEEGKTLWPHIDTTIADVIKKGGREIEDRYVMSDIMPTPFYDADLGITQAELDSGMTEDEWARRNRAKLTATGHEKFDFGNNSIVHFNTTTGHAGVNPAEPGLRTFASVWFTTVKPNKLNNPFLSEMLPQNKNAAFSAAPQSKL